MSKTPDMSNDDMPAEVYFSVGIRGKFFQSGTKISPPVYLDD